MSRLAYNFYYANGKKMRKRYRKIQQELLYEQLSEIIKPIPLDVSKPELPKRKFWNLITSYIKNLFKKGAR